MLDRELTSLTTSAEAQGWRVKTHPDSAYRLVAQDGRRFSLSLGDPRQTRRELRKYARELTEYGLRLNRTLITAVGEEPASPRRRARERKAASPRGARNPPASGQRTRKSSS